MLWTAFDILCSLRETETEGCLGCPVEKDPSCGAAENGRMFPMLTLEVIGDFSLVRIAEEEGDGRQGWVGVCLERGRREWECSRGISRDSFFISESCSAERVDR